jgi:hypothetical protein
MSASSSSPAAAARFSSLPLSDYRSNEVDLAKCTFLLDPTLPFEEADAALAAIRVGHTCLLSHLSQRGE